MQFEEYIQTLSRHDAQRVYTAWEQVTHLLTSTPVLRQFVINVEAERRADRDVWKSFCGAIVASTLTASSLKEDVTNALTKHTYASKSAFVGPEITVPQDAIMGRAVSRFGFTRRLIAEGLAADVQEAETVVDLLLARKQPHGLFRAARLATGHMWATWNPDDPSANPFPTTKREHVQQQLGLNPQYAGEDLLLLSYRVPDDGVYFPTIVEAYASSTWLRYFRPASMQDHHGWTMPWDAYQGRPAPECVHAPIFGSALIDIRQAT